MSAPETNVEKQARRHKGPLLGIAVAILAALVALVAVGLFASTDDAPDVPPAELAD
ncbi:hypothetical protein ACRDNQ_02680 [Palleronia sp. KMU-117]|uniref:hypothetical protein n=1 Tax=Palleronia sp. KMU-117 TaxID=3434108 RepID=UPI003D7199A1